MCARPKWEDPPKPKVKLPKLPYGKKVKAPPGESWRQYTPKDRDSNPSIPNS